jgi:SET domain-containing protein
LEIKKVLVLQKSKIHGIGVFAIRNFNRGEMVLLIDDSDPVPDRSKLTPEQTIHVDVFIDKDGKEKVVFMKSPEKYINTSCDPNLYSKTDMESGIRRAYAFRDIHDGEEITWDYALNSWEEWDIPAECNCGSSNCRKIIRGNFFSLPRDVQLKNIALLDGPFKQRFKEEIALIQLG